MPASYIQVPPDSSGKKTAARQLVIGSDTVQRQHVEQGITTPLMVYVTSASLAAGASVSLDSTNVTASYTARLWGLIVAAAVSFKAEVFTVANAALSPCKGFAISHTGHWQFHVPHPSFIFVPYSVTAGFDGFRVTVTNLDLSETSDVHCIFYYDEELT